MTNINSLVQDIRNRRLDAYKNVPADIREHAGIEESVLAGGYGCRQILELVQNGADAILESQQSLENLPREPRIDVILSERYLYVANTGAPLSREGVEALLQSHSSPKRGNQIGRFGLGFKSILRLAGQIDVFSSSGSLRFDPSRCQQELRDQFQLGGEHPVPSLRLAWGLDSNAEKEADSTLRGFDWATTIVRAEIRDPKIIPDLKAAILDFPNQFLLFLPVSVALNLDVAGSMRALRRTREGADFLLSDGENQSRWRVIEHHEIRISSAAAKADATHIHARETVPLAWAIPLDQKRDTAGKFWAFFPTDTQTRLPGILNAPWKLSSDRKALISGEWNRALMLEAAKLIADHLPDLATEDDPGRVLDAFPRKLDLQDEPAAPLVNGLWDDLINRALIANGNGNLCEGKTLKRPPLDLQELHVEWSKLAKTDVLTHWIHPTCLFGERPARLRELANRLKNVAPKSLTQANATDWFGAIASTDAEVAKPVLQLARHYMDKQLSLTWQSELKTIAIVPGDNGELCKRDRLVIAPLGINVPNRVCVAAALVDDPDAFRILTEVLGIHQLDDNGWKFLLQTSLDQAIQVGGTDDLKWKSLWETIRLAPANVLDNFIQQKREQLRVRRRSDVWVTPSEALFPGELVKCDDPDNVRVLIDDDLHRDDWELLSAIGVRDFPSGFRGPLDYDSSIATHAAKFKPWLDEVETNYRAKLDGSSSPQSSLLRPFPLTLPDGWMLLAELKGQANSRLTLKFADLLGKLPSSIEYGHKTRTAKYPVIKVSHPMLWYLRQHGTLAIGSYAIRIETVLARRDTSALQKVLDWRLFEPLLARFVELVGGPTLAAPSNDQIVLFWRALFDLLGTPDAIAADQLHGLWSDAEKDCQFPASLKTKNGELPLAEIYVTGSVNLAKRARAQGRPVVTLDISTQTLWLKHGAKNLDELFVKESDGVLTDPVPLITAIPELGRVLSGAAGRDAYSQSVKGLRLIIEDQAQPVSCLVWQGILYLDPEQLDVMPTVQRLRVVLDEAAVAGWLEESVKKAQDQIANVQAEKLREAVAAGQTLAEKLIIAVGKNVASLKGVIGSSAADVIPDDCEPCRIAELALAMLGPIILQKLSSTLSDEGLQPPNRWGSDEARAFVNSLGFPDEFAASSESKREAEEMISGPINLPQLHDYQEEVLGGLKELITSGTGRRRAVVSLPTGSGKTRVTVQAAVDLVLKPETLNRSVLWVAQTDELCEQAVQSFRQVWINRGAERTNLRIVRFWGGNPTPAPAMNGQPIAVIASIQTLKSRIGKENFGWLSNPGLVVVDECHHAIAPSYTGLLKWLDAEAPRPGSQPKSEPPIVGLSATPFRGASDDEENLRLAKRFDQNWLPTGQQELHIKLAERGILAVAKHEALESLTVLPPELAEKFRQGDEIGAIQLENLWDELNRTLADDDERNQLLLETIRSSAEQSILFFANSVTHAEEMAMRMNLAGIPAAAVSGTTASSARRYFLDSFQRGDIRVLCNHSVLTTGFDAPKTDMVLISRQVLSPVRYMQMVGRGLRGIKNGGTDQCRIVTVMDNLGRFNGKHPYHFCSKYFPRV